jgi:hypothetical protein
MALGSAAGSVGEGGSSNAVRDPQHLAGLSSTQADYQPAAASTADEAARNRDLFDRATVTAQTVDVSRPRLPRTCLAVPCSSCRSAHLGGDGTSRRGWTPKRVVLGPIDYIGAILPECFFREVPPSTV